VRSEGQSDSGAGLEAQRWAIAAECKRRVWELVEVVEEAGCSAEELKRPGMKEALRPLASADGEALVARKLDTPSRSLLELAGLMASAQKQGWALVALDCALETRTPGGEAAVKVLASFAPCERGLHS
jgi:DNA invertase Pin-like site-specific DNA recombinase